jgi:CDP-paratose synthetase
VQHRKVIILSGATGFLGSHLLNNLLKNEYEVIILIRSSSNLWRIENLVPLVTTYNIDKCDLDLVFKRHKIDIVIHTACKYARNECSMINVVDSNLMYGLRLLEACRRFKTKLFINTDSLLPRNVDGYSLSKKQFVDWLRFYSEGMQVINLKLEHMYGPKDDNTKLVGWFLSQLKERVPEIKLTKGEQLRDFIHIDDIVSAFSKVLESKSISKNFSEFEVCSGKVIPVKNFLLQLKKGYEDMHGISNTRLLFGAVPYRKNEMMKVDAHNHSLLKLGWMPKIELKEGIKNTLEWYL